MKAELEAISIVEAYGGLRLFIEHYDDHLVVSDMDDCRNQWMGCHDAARDFLAGLAGEIVEVDPQYF